MTGDGTPPLPGRELGSAEVEDLAQSWPITNHHELASGHVFALVSDEVLVPDGGRMTREYIRHPGAVAVIGLAESAEGDEQVVLVRQYRHPVGRVLLEPPAGLLDQSGESWLLAAQRELAEEVGLQAAKWRVLVDVFTSPGMGTEAMRIYLARDLSVADRPDGFVAAAEEAHMEMVWAELDDLAAAVMAGRVQNPALCTGVLATVAARARGYDALRPADAPWSAKD